MCFSPYLGVGGGEGGLPRGLGRNLLTQFSRLSSSKMEISEPNFVDTLTIQNDQISHLKHFLAPLYVFFPLFGCLGVGWLPRDLGHNLLMQFSRLSSSRMVVPLPSSRCLAEGNRIWTPTYPCRPKFQPPQSEGASRGAPRVLAWGKIGQNDLPVFLGIVAIAQVAN